MARRCVTREHLGMARTDRHEVPLTVEEVEVLVEALDSHEYRQLSEPTWRNSGAVILPADDESAWAERPAPTDDEVTAIVAIERCRALADRLRDHLRGQALPRTS